jgi:hypothetical protein
VQRGIYDRDWGCRCDGKQPDGLAIEGVNMGE